MSKHKSIPKKDRLKIYEKYNGHCAYCGCELNYKDMQVDHIKSVYVNMDYEDDMTDDEYEVFGIEMDCPLWKAL